MFARGGDALPRTLLQCEFWQSYRAGAARPIQLHAASFAANLVVVFPRILLQ